MVITPPCQGGVTGSIPVGTVKFHNTQRGIVAVAVTYECHKHVMIFISWNYIYIKRKPSFIYIEENKFSTAR